MSDIHELVSWMGMLQAQEYTRKILYGGQTSVQVNVSILTKRRHSSKMETRWIFQVYFGTFINGCPYNDIHIETFEFFTIFADTNHCYG